jgi:uncharacterized protein (TIGR00369 family)
MAHEEFLASPYHRFLGFEVVRMDSGTAEIRLPFRPDFLRQDGSEWLHGGITAALIDITGDAAIHSVVGTGVPTIDIRIDYLRPAKGELYATAKAVRTGRIIAVADIEVHNADWPRCLCHSQPERNH